MAAITDNQTGIEKQMTIGKVCKNPGTLRYKVLIADDEYWTREKIKHIIRWEKYSLELLEPAADGEEVLKRLEQERPDILITDINMPFLDGVELLQIMKEQYPEIITFVISGYDDFDYVKNTFMAGSINYLLKPINKIDLVNALSKALEIISSRQYEKENEEKQKENLLKASSFIQDREFSLLLEKEGSSLPANITMSNTLHFTGVSLVLIKIHNMKELTAQYHYDMNLLSYHIKREIKDVIDDEDMVVFNHVYRPNEFLVVSHMENQELKNRANKFMVRFSPSVHSPVTIILSEHSYSMESIHNAYVQTVSLLMTRRFRKENALLVFEATHDRKQEDKILNRVKDVQIKELKMLLKQKNKTAVKGLIFDTIGLGRCELEGWEYLDVKQTVRRILNVIFEYSSLALSPEELIGLENMTDMMDKTLESLDMESLHEAVEMILDAVISVREKEGSELIRDGIKQAVAYVDENYFEELSLSSIAKRFHVESTYFSRLFRQETGENFVMYITRRRVEKAIEYIKNSDKNLTEIAFMVGYVDYTYFNRVFRKMTGKSPRDFKREIEQMEVAT